MKLANVNNNSEQDYRQFLKDLEHNIFNEYPIIGLANAKLIVTKADFESILIASMKLKCMLMI